MSLYMLLLHNNTFIQLLGMSENRLNMSDVSLITNCSIFV